LTTSRGSGCNPLFQGFAQSRDQRLTAFNAWTRDDADTLHRYQATVFTDSGHYPPVYANCYTALEDPGRASRPATTLNLAEVQYVSREGQTRV
jgi:hypothetical protein